MAKKSKMVRVSPDMLELRTVLESLNRFVWTTELCYGYGFTDPAGHFADPAKRTHRVLGHVTKSQAWYPNRHGKIRFDETVGTFLSQIAGNTNFVYRSIIVFFLASFEEFLNKRVRERNKWGPYIVTLPSEGLTATSTPVRLPTILCADICRKVRNTIAHNPSTDLPNSIPDATFQGWRDELAKSDPTLACKITDAMIRRAKDHFFQEAKEKVRKSKARKREHPLELFYMLFTLANLDKLAMEVDAALPPTDNMTVISQKLRRAVSETDGRQSTVIQ